MFWLAGVATLKVSGPNDPSHGSQSDCAANQHRLPHVYRASLHTLGFRRPIPLGPFNPGNHDRFTTACRRRQDSRTKNLRSLCNQLT